MARVKFYNQKTGKWEYADAAFGGSGNGQPGADPETVTLLPADVLNFYNSTAYPDDDYTVSHLSKITYPYRADIPVPYTVKWNHRDDAMRTTVAVDTKEIGTVNRFGMLTYDATGFDNYPLYNLIPNTTYFYKVTHIMSDGSLVEAKSGRFKASGEPWRLLYIDGTQNVRDLGGWACFGGRTVKYGNIIRGAAFSDSSYPELMLTGKGRRALGSLKVQAELNLGAFDTETSIAANCVYKKIGYSNYATAITDETARANFKAALEWIVECLNASKPIYMHCQGGCDRTGTLSFLLLGLLGVSESDLAKEYELSSFSSIGFGRRRTTTKAVDTYDYVGMVEAIKAYSGDTISDKFYNFAITGCGISADTITSFRNLMLTESQNAPTLTSITAAFAQGDRIVYPSTSLADLKTMLTVTAKYSDGSTVAVDNYTLSGTLATGNSTVTVSYSGCTTTFTVVVTTESAESYTNLVPTSITSNGAEYIGTGDGYNEGYRLSSSGEESAYDGGICCGFIPYVNASDVIRITGHDSGSAMVSGYNRIFFYDSSFAKIGYMNIHNAECGCEVTTNEATGTWEIKADLSTNTMSNGTRDGAAYFRVGLGVCSDASKFIITRNQEIT